MKISSLLTVRLLICVLLLLAPAVAQAVDEDTEKLLKFLETEHAPLEPLLPVDVRITDGFEPGKGIPTGVVQVIHGTVLVFHKGSKIAYRLEEKMPVFRGDTLVTETDGRVSLLMNDKSLLTLTARSKLVIDKSFYHLGKKTSIRDTKLQLLFGRVRAVVSKMTGDSEYTITTPTAVAGVRGTDFALTVGLVFKKTSECESFPLLIRPDYAADTNEFVPSLMTAIVTGENNSTVEFAGIAGTPVIVNSLSVAGAVSECPVDKAVHVGSTALNLLKNIAPEVEQLLNLLTEEQELLRFLSKSYQWLERYPAGKELPVSPILKILERYPEEKDLPVSPIRPQ